MQIDVLRPISILAGTGWSAQPSGTLNGVTSDDSDASYARRDSNTWLQLAVTSHTPPAGMQRHRIRANLRGQAASGTAAMAFRTERIASINPGNPTDTVVFSTTPSTAQGTWHADPSMQLGSPGAELYKWLVSSTAALARAVEAYVEVDNRLPPVFVPEILDGAGVDQAGGTVTDTNLVTFSFGAVDYDGLTARTWRMAVYTLAETTSPGFAPFDPGFQSVFEQAGNATPTSQSFPLSNGDYVAYFQAYSTIRTDDPYASDIESAAFTVDVSLPFPPVNLTATPTTDPPTIELCWEAPGGTLPWADGTQVHAQIERTDCNGTEIIALIADGLTGCYVDRFMSLSESGFYCGDEDHDCQICYRVRYWGYITETVDPITEPIPDGVILAWPSTVASIPAGFSRASSLDGRYPKGIPTAGTNPGGTGGSTTHTHTTPAHNHAINHNHGGGGNVNAAGGPTVPFQVPDIFAAAAGHVHSRPTTGTATINSANASPNAAAASSEQSRKEVIFITSNGTATAVPVGVMALHHASSVPSGWETEGSNGAAGSARPPYLKGAAGGGNGSLAFTDVDTHTHGVDAHTHGATSHGHTGGQSGLPNINVPSIVGAGNEVAADTHRHALNVGNANTAALNSGSGGTSGAQASTLAHRYTNFIRAASGGGAQFPGLIGLWLGTIASIPTGWLLCDGTNGTPDFIGRYPRYYGGHSVNGIGGGAAHDHTTPTHGHTTGSHAHPVTVGGSTVNRDSTTSTSGDTAAADDHTHTASNTATATPSVGSKSPGNTSADTPEPAFTSVAFIMLESADVTPLTVPLLVVTEWEEICVDALPNPHPGNDWIRGIVSGDVSICPRRDWSYTRPFGVFQPIAGGVPTVITGAEGLRDYSLVIGVNNNATMSALEAVLAQPLVYYQPAGFGTGFDQWMAPRPGASWNDPQVNRVRAVSVSFVGVNAPPVADPFDVIPFPDTPSSP